ncbi:MAG: phenylalanine--tRNA ligase subunit beta [Clostridia bacterium]|nr:phenylalanine--tRNA ligase subunit beta [Clostridia bacterium]
MKLPLSWLKDFVNIDDIQPKELADKMLNIGFEVEEIIYTGENIKNVVVGKILDIKKHFSADKLQICTVDVGSEITTIVTGATNIVVGDKVPVALDDSYLPTGAHIVASELRGVMSYGMFCSGGELMIDDTVIEGAEVNGILILPADTEIGADIRDVLGLNEYVFDVSILANRPDCQSIYGIAREIAALFGKKAKKPSLSYKVYESNLTIPNATVSDKQLCSLYTGRLITDIKIEKSPKWMRDRLRNVGIRPINNVVDITNYVLVEMGQPLHAFDLSLIDKRIEVRRAKKNEKITALDGKEYALTTDMLVIADDKKPVAIAGVMGGEYSGINDDTKTVFLEAARFSRENIRTTSRALGLRSDSSARYEKGVDWQSVELGRERALALFHQLKAGKVTSLATCDGVEEPKIHTIETTTDKINDLFGITVKQADMVKILKSLEFGVTTKGNTIICEVPLFRDDVDNYTDLAEEIIRFYGYDALGSDFIKNAKPTVGGMSARQKNVAKIKNIMVSAGAFECITYSFINPKQFDKLAFDENAEIRNTIKIINPLSEEFSVMRTQLVGSMLGVVAVNQSKKNGDFRLFEVAKSYVPKKLPLTELPNENETLCIALSGASEDFYGLKAIVGEVLDGFVDYKIVRTSAPYLHPGKGADIVVDGKIIGSFGKIHPTVADNYGISQDVYVAEICLEGFINKEEGFARFTPLPKFPAVDRDLAVVVKDSYSVGELIDCIKSVGTLCKSVELFDVYKGEQIESGYKSLAFSLKLQSQEKTLVDSEIQEFINGVITALGQKFGAKLR